MTWLHPRSDQAITFRSEIIGEAGFCKEEGFSGLKGTQCQWPEFVRCYHAPGKPNVSGRMNCQIISIKYLDGSAHFMSDPWIFFFVAFAS